MYFHTWSFAVFFLIAYVAYVLLRPTRFAMPCLLGASYIFYAWGKPSAATAVLYLILIFYVSLFDYLAVLLMSLTGRRKFFLVLSLLNGITLLALFKYGAFVSEAVNSLLSLLGIPYHLPAPDLFVPVGLSFYIFQSMTYTIDCYRGRIPREKSFLRYAAFVAFFPRLLAGPIERAARFLPQLAKRPRISMNDVADGASLFIVGLFKKLALADYLALYVNNVYDAPHRFGSPALALAAFLFSWQIYFDFSGYSDMARGLARMMGMRVMLNFNNPYLATGLPLHTAWRKPPGHDQNVLQYHRSYAGLGPVARGRFLGHGLDLPGLGSSARGRGLRNLQPREIGLLPPKNPQAAQAIVCLCLCHVRLDLLPRRDSWRGVGHHRRHIYRRLRRPTLPPARSDYDSCRLALPVCL